MSVSQTHDTFLMYADSEKEMDGWIDAIIRVLYEVSGGWVEGNWGGGGEEYEEMICACV